MHRTRLFAVAAVCVIGLVTLAGGLWLAAGRSADVRIGSGTPNGEPGTSSPTTGSPATTPPATTPATSPPTTAPPTSTTAKPTTTTTTAPPTTVPPTSVPPTVPPTTAPAPELLQLGDAGEAVRVLQARLHELGYWIGAIDGVYGHLTEQAVTAFQKVERLAADGVAGPATAAALEHASRPAPRSASGDRVEIDKERQVLLVVRDGAVRWVFNTSTGTEQPYELNGETLLADTPAGHWAVEWVVDDYDVGELGPLYRPRYFHYDGIAVHGYPHVPPYPASHGCVRVTEAAMDFIWEADLMPVGSEVWVH